MIARDDPTSHDVASLVATHVAFGHEHSPPEDVHALDTGRLADERISFFSARVDGQLLAIGALKRLDDEHVELKSMHTVQSRRGAGVGRAMLRHLLDVARQRGYARVSLETGSMDAFAPARALYASAGFVECPPFANYVTSTNSTFMTMTLQAT